MRPPFERWPKSALIVRVYNGGRKKGRVRGSVESEKVEALTSCAVCCRAGQILRVVRGARFTVERVCCGNKAGLPRPEAPISAVLYTVYLTLNRCLFMSRVKT